MRPQIHRCGFRFNMTPAGIFLCLRTLLVRSTAFTVTLHRHLSVAIAAVPTGITR